MTGAARQFPATIGMLPTKQSSTGLTVVYLRWSFYGTTFLFSWRTCAPQSSVSGWFDFYPFLARRLQWRRFFYSPTVPPPVLTLQIIQRDDHVGLSDRCSRRLSGADAHLYGNRIYLFNRHDPERRCAADNVCQCNQHAGHGARLRACCGAGDKSCAFESNAGRRQFCPIQFFDHEPDTSGDWTFAAERSSGHHRQRKRL